MPSFFRLDPYRLLLCSGFFALSACGEPPAQEQMPPPQVSVETVKTQPLTLTTELNGRLVSPRTAEVRARVMQRAVLYEKKETGKSLSQPIEVM